MKDINKLIKNYIASDKNIDDFISEAITSSDIGDTPQSFPKKYKNKNNDIDEEEKDEEKQKDK